MNKVECIMLKGGRIGGWDRVDGRGHTNGKQDECVMVGATVVTVELVREHPNLRFCLRLGGTAEAVHRPKVEGGKVVLVEE
jgi:hypothetical protein